LSGERLVVGQVDRELERRVKRGADAGLPVAVLGDPLAVADDPILGAVDAEVLARDVHTVAVHGAGVAHVGGSAKISPKPAIAVGLARG
jgi:hypothetical protein